MMVTAGFLLLCMAAAISASSNKDQPYPVSDGQNYPGTGRWSGARIGTVADDTASRSFASIDNGSQHARRRFSDARALRDGQDQQQDPDNLRQIDKDEISKIWNRDTENLPPVGVPQNMDTSKAVEPAPSAVQQAVARAGQYPPEYMRRSYRSGYSRRSPSVYESRSSEETEQNGRDFRWQPRRNGGTRSSSEERSRQGRHSRQRYVDDYGSQSSEEYRPSGGRARPHSRRGSEDDSREDGRRPYGRGRPTVFEGFD